MRELCVGDRVKLIDVPDWLIRDLPDDEKQEIIACVGKEALIDRVDNAGYYWLGFGVTAEEGGAAYYSGHSFCVPSECLQVVRKD